MLRRNWIRHSGLGYGAAADELRAAASAFGQQSARDLPPGSAGGGGPAASSSSSTAGSSSSTAGQQDGETQRAWSSRAGPSIRWREGQTVEQPDFFGSFFADSKKPGAASAAKKKKTEAPLKTFEEYSAMETETLQKLHDIRTQQIAELKMLHERSHRNIEYFYRKQALDYDEKALNYGEAAGSLSMDQIGHHRRRLGDLRVKDFTAGRDKGIVLWICAIVTVVWWVWLISHYPKKLTVDNKAPLTTSWRAWSNPLSTDTRWLGRGVLTSWEYEQLQKKNTDGKMTFTAMPDSIMTPGAGYRVKMNHEMTHETKI